MKCGIDCLITSYNLSITINKYITPCSNGTLEDTGIFNRYIRRVRGLQCEYLILSGKIKYIYV